MANGYTTFTERSISSSNPRVARALYLTINSTVVDKWFITSDLCPGNILY